MPPSFALIIFWLILAVLIFKSEGKVTGFEAAGVTLIFCAILFIFILGHPLHAFTNTPLLEPNNLFSPFGAVFFRLRDGRVSSRFMK